MIATLADRHEPNCVDAEYHHTLQIGFEMALISSQQAKNAVAIPKLRVTLIHTELWNSDLLQGEAGPDCSVASRLIN